MPMRVRDSVVGPAGELNLGDGAFACGGGEREGEMADDDVAFCYGGGEADEEVA